MLILPGREMDIFAFFKTFNFAKNIFPGLFNLEGQVSANVHVESSFLARIVYRGLALFLLFSVGILIYGAFASISYNVVTTDNVLAIVIFLDNYGPLFLHMALFMVTRKPIPILALIYRIDVTLLKFYKLSINYEKIYRKFRFHCILFEIGFMLIMGLFFVEYIFLETEWYHKVIVIYFTYIWTVFILQLVVYYTLISILRSQVRLITKNLNKISLMQRITFCQFIRSVIESANEIGSGIIFIFITFSSFYTTLACFVIIRFYEAYFDLIDPFYILGSCFYLVQMMTLNAYLVTNAWSLQRELLSLYKKIEENFQGRFDGLVRIKLYELEPINY